MMAKNGKRIYHFELDGEEVFNLLQAARMGAADHVGATCAAVLRDMKDGNFGAYDSAEEALDGCRVVFQRQRQAHDKIVDQWCEQEREAGNEEDAEVWNHLKTNMEVTAQNLDNYENEIIKKAAEVQRSKLHIIK